MTIRTQTEMLEDYADGQGAGALTPLKHRNMIESLRSNQGTGWANYVDDAKRLEINSQTILADTRTLLAIDGEHATTNITQIGLLGANIWNTSTNKINPAIEGDSYDIRVIFKTKKALGSDAHIKIEIDIGGAIGVIAEDVRQLVKGAGVEQASMFPFPVFVGSTFIVNGGEIFCTPSAEVEVWAPAILIIRTHTPMT